MGKMRPAVGEPEITIIVPVYNAEKYLDRCLESIVGQTLEDIEIVLVNDGSTDESLALCREWEKKDHRIKVITKENGGLSSARNAGVAVASAPYVGFVDSDDFIEPDMYERLLTALRNESADMSACGLRSCYSNYIAERPNTGISCLSNVEAMKEMISHHSLYVCSVVKLYPTKLVREHPFQEGVTSEDVFFIADIFPHVQKVAVDMTPCYNWMRRGGSISTKPFNDSSLDVVAAYEYCADRLLDDYPELAEAIDFRRMWARFSVLDSIAKSSNRHEEHVREVERRTIRELKENKDLILSSPYVGRGRKLAYRLLCIHPALYRMAVAFQEKRFRTYEG